MVVTKTFDLANEFRQETETRLLADQLRICGINARIADDVFDEYVGLEQKKNYLEERIELGKRALANFSFVENLTFVDRKEKANYFCDLKDSILRGVSHIEDEINLVKIFYAISRYKSANDEMFEALQEFNLATKGRSDNQQKAKTQMAKILFGADKSDDTLNMLADRFVNNGTCETLMSKLKICSASGEKKWKDYGSLMIGSGKIYPYCGTKLNSQDYEFNVANVKNEINDFVTKELQNTKVKRSKFLFGRFIAKVLNHQAPQLITTDRTV